MSGSGEGLAGLFAQTAKVGASIHRANTAAPFSLRLTPEERAYLDEQAGGRPLGAYIRARLLGDKADRRRASRKPKIDDQRLAHVLAELGASRLSSNLNQLAKAVNTGTLEVSAETEKELLKACAAVVAMRDTLIAALGIKSESGQ